MPTPIKPPLPELETAPEDLPLYNGGNTTGFVSPASDSLESPIELAEVLDLKRPSRYLVRVSGDGMRERGIFPDDIIVVDSSLKPTPGCIGVVFLSGEVLLVTIRRMAGKWWLHPASDEMPAIPADEAAEIWGIACGLVRRQV